MFESKDNKGLTQQGSQITNGDIYIGSQQQDDKELRSLMQKTPVVCQPDVLYVYNNGDLTAGEILNPIRTKAIRVKNGALVRQDMIFDYVFGTSLAIASSGWVSYCLTLHRPSMKAAQEVELFVFFLFGVGVLLWSLLSFIFPQLRAAAVMKTLSKRPKN